MEKGEPTEQSKYYRNWFCHKHKKTYILYKGAKRPGSRGEATRFNFRGETTRGVMVWERNVLLPR